MTLDPHAIRAVVDGEHGDPFAVLGRHGVQTRDGAAVAVRAIVPGAAAVRVLPADAPPTAMERLHPVGFFETVLPDRPDPFAYRLEVTRDGHITEIEDPYRFPSLLSDFDRHLLAEGTHYRAHEKLGAHPAVLEGVAGVAFAVWAPSARRVSVVGDFNDWDGRAHPMRLHPANGICEVFVPGMEHPCDGSWGYQPIGYFAPARRYGSPREFMAFVDHLHRRGVGVILDWVPAHFPRDPHGLVYFDGPHLYEHADPRQREHPDWGTLIFNYGRNEVANFLLDSALFWLDRYHADGLRVDAVASALYLDYSRKPGEWVPNQFGGRENLGAVAFFRRMNEVVHAAHPGVVVAAEESTSWPMVSRPTYLGGLGFGFKWNLGWMHDVLDYMSLDPVHRKYHHNRLTFGLLYAWTENFVLPLSHDEVVHGKGSLLAKMPGDDWQQFANLRALYAYMWAHPGKKLLFMRGEIGQLREWHHDPSLDWHLLGAGPYHRGLQRLGRDLNRLYRRERALYERDADPAGFAWVDCAGWEQSGVSFVRRARDAGDFVLVVCNFTPVPRHAYRVGVPWPGYYRELINSDAGEYAGSNLGNEGGAWAEPTPWQGQPHSLALTLPPLAVLVLKPS